MAVLIIDIVLSNSEGAMYYSLFSKCLLLVILLGGFMPRSRNMHPVVRTCTLLGMVSFVMGEVFVMIDNDLNTIVTGFLLLMVAKLCYSCAFVYTIRIDIDRLLPYLVFVTLYSLVVIYFLYDLPEHVPAYLFLVTTLFMLKLAYLRFEKVSKVSFARVFAGASMVLVAETILVFDRSFSSFSWSGILIVLLFGMSQYLMVSGVLQQPEPTPSVLG